MCLNKAFYLSTFALCVFLINTSISVATDFDPVAQSPGAAVIDANTNANLMRAVGQSDLSPESKNIQVTSKNGSTIIRGIVKDEREKQTISNLAEQNGCPDIKNELTVSSSSTTKPKSAPKALIINKGR